ncbi:MAG: CoA transferase [Betaproteobacteria bacterium]|nr:CoA transferase [Betaproteobacteria bacterium]
MALAGLRVLDLSGPMGNYCGKLFADMGADVILIEPPAGTRLRFEPPFLDDIAGPERSLAFAYHNTSKRGISLNLDCASGQELLRKLAATSDIMIETEKPGAMQRRGLGYEVLSKIKPGLVLASITAFGQSGPYAQYESEDLIGLALGGLLYLGGYPDAPPTRVYGNQAYLCASMYGAVAAMLALLDAESSGRGQHVDVSMQECVVLGLENAVQFYDLEGTVRKRYAGEQRFAGTGVFECKDGYIYLMAGGIGANKFWGCSVDWLRDEHMAGVERLRGNEWTQVDYLKSEEAKRIFAELFTPWAKTRTKAYLYHEGQRRHIPIAPINVPADLLENRQLNYRNHFVEVTHALRDRPMLMPGAPYKLSETPWRIQRPAPRLGEHNAEVYGEVGVSRAELERLFAAGAV